MELELKDKISKIQQEMKAPKNLWNKFGQYSYRNAEGILEAFKPYEDKYKVFLTVSDSLEQCGDRIYIKATATLFDCESDNYIFTTAYAREALEKKGMDESQITGTASSYARKYALNGLFLLDDTKDADTDEYKQQEEQGKEEKKSEAKRIYAKTETVKSVCKKHGLNARDVCRMNGFEFEKASEAQLDNLIFALKKKFGDD